MLLMFCCCCFFLLLFEPSTESPTFQNLKITLLIFLTSRNPSYLLAGFSSRSLPIVRQKARPRTRCHSSVMPMWWRYTDCCGTIRRGSASTWVAVGTTRLSGGGPSTRWPPCWPTWDRLDQNLSTHSTFICVIRVTLFVKRGKYL